MKEKEVIRERTNPQKQQTQYWSLLHPNTLLSLSLSVCLSLSLSLSLSFSLSPSLSLPPSLSLSLSLPPSPLSPFLSLPLLSLPALASLNRCVFNSSKHYVC